MSATEHLAEVQGRAEKQAAAYARMLELNGGVGLLGVRHPAMFEDMLAWDESSENGHADTVLTLVAALRAVLDLHKPRTVQGFTGDCAAEMCDHEEECPTVPFEECVECDRLAEEIDAYYAERSLAPTAWPCATTLAIEGALT